MTILKVLSRPNLLLLVLSAASAKFVFFFEAHLLHFRHGLWKACKCCKGGGGSMQSTQGKGGSIALLKT